MGSKYLFFIKILAIFSIGYCQSINYELSYPVRGQLVSFLLEKNNHSKTLSTEDHIQWNAKAKDYPQFSISTRVYKKDNSDTLSKVSMNIQMAHSDLSYWVTRQKTSLRLEKNINQDGYLISQWEYFPSLTESELLLIPPFNPKDSLSNTRTFYVLKEWSTFFSNPIVPTKITFEEPKIIGYGVKKEWRDLQLIQFNGIDESGIKYSYLYTLKSKQLIQAKMGDFQITYSPQK